MCPTALFLYCSKLLQNLDIFFSFSVLAQITILIMNGQENIHI